MDNKKRSIRLGAAVLIFAVILRLGGGITRASAHVLRLPEAAQTILLRRPQGGMQIGEKPEPTHPQPTVPAPPVLPIFSAADLSHITMRYASGCKYRPDLEQLIRKPLQWDLDSGNPTVLIVHTHGSESYTKTKGQNYAECGSYRTRETEYNMVAVGGILAQKLEEAGIRVIHDRTLHDDPSYNAAYSSSREAVQRYLAQYPSIQLVLDLHRDAATYSDGTQYATSVTVDGEKIAQLMLVMGTDSAGLHYPNWQENLSVALKMLVQLEKLAPGITRTTTLRTSRYNQDLHSAMLLVEVGSAGNTLSQAKAAAEYLAEAIIALKNGAN